uniref:Uncharacterized protein n=1 Tax=Glossina brevipalpis TaxID=37001 RepID=A0A1A9W8W9_9MUSC
MAPFSLMTALGRWVSNKSIATTVTEIFQKRLFTCGQAREPSCGDILKAKGCMKAPEKKKEDVVRQQYPKPLPAREREIVIPVKPECCLDPCKDALPRFDLLYYKRTDKLKRKYQQTWAECPELLKKPKVICCYDKIKYPKMEKRKRKDRPETACMPTCLSARSQCPSFKLPNCREARKPPKCAITRRPLKCKKKKAPYPSFSECSRKRPPPLHPIECHCLAIVPMCELVMFTKFVPGKNFNFALSTEFSYFPVFGGQAGNGGVCDICNAISIVDFLWEVEKDYPVYRQRSSNCKNLQNWDRCIIGSFLMAECNFNREFSKTSNIFPPTPAKREYSRFSISFRIGRCLVYPPNLVCEGAGETDLKTDRCDLSIKTEDKFEDSITLCTVK